MNEYIENLDLSDGFDIEYKERNGLNDSVIYKFDILGIPYRIIYDLYIIPEYYENVLGLSFNFGKYRDKMVRSNKLRYSGITLLMHKIQESLLDITKAYYAPYIVFQPYKDRKDVKRYGGGNMLDSSRGRLYLRAIDNLNNDKFSIYKTNDEVILYDLYYSINNIKYIPFHIINGLLKDNLIDYKYIYSKTSSVLDLLLNSIRYDNDTYTFSIDIRDGLNIYSNVNMQEFNNVFGEVVIHSGGKEVFRKGYGKRYDNTYDGIRLMVDIKEFLR